MKSNLNNSKIEKQKISNTNEPISPNTNILSQRYADEKINEIFSPEFRIKTEREFWINVLETQVKLGLKVPNDTISKYKSAINRIDLERIEHLENSTKHDVKAKIEAFNEAAGNFGNKNYKSLEQIHRGLTSRDLNDNVDLILNRLAAKHLLAKYCFILKQMDDIAKKYESLPLTARTHHQVAQITTFGRRFSMWAEELLYHLKNFSNFIDNLPFRGIKGAIGTQQDMSTLIGTKNAKILDQKIAQKYDFKNLMSSVGQIYPRSIDAEFINHLVLISSPIQSFTKTLRLMSGLGLASEGFAKGQTGSSAMPHKQNPRSCERVNSLGQLLKGYSASINNTSGDQWEEGDVSCSAIRRITISDACYTSDGIANTTSYILKNMGPNIEAINKEVTKYKPLLSTTNVMMELTKRGIGREKAHEIIKLTSLKYIEIESATTATFSKLLIHNLEISKIITEAELNKIISMENTGRAKEQIKETSTMIKKFLRKQKINNKEMDIL
jgi:adenylosuccinate lyase